MADSYIITWRDDTGVKIKTSIDGVVSQKGAMMKFNSLHESVIPISVIKEKFPFLINIGFNDESFCGN